MLVYIVIYLLLVNLLAFVTMYRDKQKAKKNEWRTPESSLWTYAFIGGVFGIFAGMRVFRHKTKHNSFKYGVPLVILAYLTIFVFVLQKMS